MTEPPFVGGTRWQRAREVEASMKRLEPGERRAFLRGYRDQEVAAQRRRPVPGWLARRSTRRALAATSALPLISTTVAGFSQGTTAGAAGLTGALLVIGLIVLLACWTLLRRATNLLADATDEVLDEREREERGRVYVVSQQLLGGMLPLLVLVAVLSDGGGMITTVGLSHLLIGVMVTSILLPSAVTAWRWRDLPE